MRTSLFSRGGFPGWVLFALFSIVSRPIAASPITALAFSPEGQLLVSNGDRRLDIRSAKDAMIQRQIDCALMKITSIAFAPHGRLLAVGGGDPSVIGKVFILSWPDGKVVHRLTNHSDVVTQVVFDAVGTHLAVASSDHTAKVWTLSERGALTNPSTLIGHAGPVLSIAFSPSGQSLVTVSADRSVKVWSADGLSLLRSFSHHTEAIHALAFRPRTGPDDSAPVSCATSGDDHTVRLWQPEMGRMVRIVRQHEGPVFALVWSRDGTALFSAGKEGIIRCFDGASDTLQTQWRAHEDWIYALALSPDGGTLASGDWSGKVRVHDLQTLVRPGKQ